ncbi:hypothetical protein Zm00014a_021144 [Zea mays]|uniref:Uncharacterized protein n=1 Tax=Zea mays TaxID=4577 RepID=A0A3L6GBH4_MAIZE|nr:hypothetical protein Zm00014a_021144 [Zea mays]
MASRGGDPVNQL